MMVRLLNRSDPIIYFEPRSIFALTEIFYAVIPSASSRAVREIARVRERKINRLKKRRVLVDDVSEYIIEYARRARLAY